MMKRLVLGKIAYRLFKDEATHYAKGDKDSRELSDKAEQKAKKKKTLLRGVYEDVTLFIEALRAWKRGEYTNFPYRTIVLLIVGLLYFLSPVDLIPDFFIGLGLLDDAAVVAFIAKQVQKDLQPFRKWKNTQIIENGHQK